MRRFELFVGDAAPVAALLLVLFSRQVQAHGFAGDRFFPATIATDDPFVADEMSLPTVTVNPPGSDGSKETDIGFDLSKRITPRIDLTFDDQWKYFSLPQNRSKYGWDALTTGAQYQLFVDAPHEAIGLVNLSTTWVHTGTVHGAAASDFTTVSPGFDFGKGFGDLQQSLMWVRPFALTGNLSVDFPTKTAGDGVANPNIFDYAFALEYSLEYLEHNVKDVGLRPPFDHMIPLVEVAMQTPFNRGQGSQTTGTVQPGLIWAGQYYQIGAEAILPINSLAGHGYGGIVQLHFYLDDLFPDSIGKPLFGG